MSQILLHEILETMKSNGVEDSTKASAVAKVFIEREVAKTQMAARNSHLLGVASQIMASINSREAYDKQHWDKQALDAVDIARILIRTVNEARENNG